ncbi:hypothetical protein HNR61_004297 [Actinomadura namibiensis]|uniref:Uncharacterized protein n=1 Tax=Actinomadura namibiensis TaxID=182080 RepID=A0A7W3LQU2_ACTNM|nr:hypothetical protein [Actinomadura namibiensis]
MLGSTALLDMTTLTGYARPAVRDRHLLGSPPGR